MDAGFTLVELLVVVVILGVLAAVVVFAVGGSTDRAQDSACAAERSSLETAVEAYRASATEYPATITDLTEGENRFLRSEPTLYRLSGTQGDIELTQKGIEEQCAAPN
jgi:prepilin-type N-terminal cleavage/methylation domain-containing protein